jgi:hypothetical protein
LSSLPSLIETVLKHQLGGVSKSIEERLIKSMAERMFEKVVPKLLGKPQFVNACQRVYKGKFGERWVSLFKSHDPTSIHRAGASSCSRPAPRAISIVSYCFPYV